MVTVIDLDFGIVIEHANTFSCKASTHQDPGTMVTNVAGRADRSEFGVGRLVHSGDFSWAAPFAGAPARVGWPVGERFVRAQRVVNRSPTLEIGLEMGQRVTPRLGQEFPLQGAIEAFDLALGLRMVRPAVDGVDPEADQPGVEPRQPDTGVPGGERVVAEDRLGESDIAE
jgi:hypothetical protein